LLSAYTTLTTIKRISDPMSKNVGCFCFFWKYDFKLLKV
jgi:hypothetical protein